MALLRALALLAAVVAVTSLPCLVALAINAEEAVERGVRAVRRWFRRRRTALAAVVPRPRRSRRGRAAGTGVHVGPRRVPRWWPFGRSARWPAAGDAVEPAADGSPAGSAASGDVANGTADLARLDVDWDELERSATAPSELGGSRASLTRRRRLAQLAWALRHTPDELREPAGPPIEQVAADLRRLGQQRLGIATRSPVWFAAVSRAYDDRLRAACRALGIEEHLTDLTGVDLEIERVRVEGVLKAAGMRFGEVTDPRDDPR